MRVAGLPLVLQAVLLSIVFPAAGDSAEIGRTAFHRHRHHAHVSETGRTMFRGQSLEAKIHFCSECHGRLGQGFAGYYTIPQLAGQQLPYIKNQFKAIHERVRDDPLVAKIMWPYLRDLDPEIWSGLAEHFSALPPTAHPEVPKISWPRVKSYSRRVSQTRTSRHARPATATKPKVAMWSPAWRGSSMRTRPMN